jgi:hypothetical protein
MAYMATPMIITARTGMAATRAEHIVTIAGTYII